MSNSSLNAKMYLKQQEWEIQLAEQDTYIMSQSEKNRFKMKKMI